MASNPSPTIPGFSCYGMIPQDCTSAEDSDDDDSGSSSNSNDSDDEGPSAKLCPKKGGWGTVVVQSEEKRQEIIGFGGAFTDAAYINFFKLPEHVQEKVRWGRKASVFAVNMFTEAASRCYMLTSIVGQTMHAAQASVPLEWTPVLHDSGTSMD